MSRRLWSGLLITEMSTPPISAAFSTFSIVPGGVPFLAPMFLWNWVPVKLPQSSGGKHMRVEVDDHLGACCWILRTMVRSRWGRRLPRNRIGYGRQLANMLVDGP